MQITEGFVLLTRALNTPGQRVHTAQNGHFVHLATDLVHTHNHDAAREGNVTFHIFIGNREHGIQRQIVGGIGQLLSNMYIESGEEVWVSTSCPDQFVIHGFTTKKQT